MAISEVRPSMASKEETPKNKNKRSSILGTLREAINKVRFLLSFSATRWMLLAGACRGSPRRSLSFDVRPPGLLDAEGGIIASPASSSSSMTSRSTSLGTASSRSLSSGSSSSVSSPEPAAGSSGGSPEASSSGGDSDIDRRAGLFIDNFRRHLQMERQISLELRYVRLNGRWERTPSL